jgi:hypothetical protein
MRTLVRFGAPAGVEMLLNVAAFNLFVQFMYSYGTGVAAAVTIAFNWDIVAFIPMLGMSFATTSLVGQFVGARDFAQARRAAWLSLRVAWVYSGAMVVVFLAAAGALVRTFASGFPGDTAEISRLATVLIRLASTRPGGLRPAGRRRGPARSRGHPLCDARFSGPALAFLRRGHRDDPFPAHLSGRGLDGLHRLHSPSWVLHVPALTGEPLDGIA